MLMMLLLAVVVVVVDAIQQFERVFCCRFVMVLISIEGFN